MSANERSASSWRKKLGLGAASFVFALLIAEIGLRAYANHENEQTLCRALAAPPKIAPNGQATLAGIIRLAADDRIAYELKPNMKDIVFKDGVLSTNSRGFRSPELPATREPNTVTIVGIGDSIMFGHGVSDGDPYLEQLRLLLVAAHPEIDWRVVNTGVPGYNTVMEVATLEQKCLGFAPDLVILGVTGNDYDPPVFVRDEVDVFALNRSFLWGFVEARVGDPQKPRTPNGLLFLDVWAKDRSTGAPVPARYAGLYGKEAFLGALDRLKEIKEREHLDVLAFATIDFESSPEMMVDLEQRGFATLHLQPQLVEYMERTTGQPFDWERYKTSDLVASPKNQHPSRIQHHMAAERIHRWMLDSGWLERVLQARHAAPAGR